MKLKNIDFKCYCYNKFIIYLSCFLNRNIKKTNKANLKSIIKKIYHRRSNLQKYNDYILLMKSSHIVLLCLCMICQNARTILCQQFKRNVR